MGDEFHKECTDNSSEPEEVGGNDSGTTGNAVGTASTAEGAVRDAFTDYFVEHDFVHAHNYRADAAPMHAHITILHAMVSCIM